MTDNYLTLALPLPLTAVQRSQQMQESQSMPKGSDVCNL